MITDFVGLKGLWTTVFMIALVFGFLPGAALRLFVLLLPRTDPRRKELIAELYGVPRWERVTWVAQQLEVCIFEGLIFRLGRRWKRLLSLGAHPLGRLPADLVPVLNFVFPIGGGALALLLPPILSAPIWMITAFATAMVIRFDGHESRAWEVRKSVEIDATDLEQGQTQQASE